MIKMYENLKSVRIPTGEEWNAFMDVTDENNNIANWKDMSGNRFLPAEGALLRLAVSRI